MRRGGMHPTTTTSRSARQGSRPDALDFLARDGYSQNVGCVRSGREVLMRHRLTFLAVLVAFLVSQAVLLDHRARHASEAAAERAASTCPHHDTSTHFCNTAAIDGHRADCIYCTAGPGRLDIPLTTGIISVRPFLLAGSVAEHIVVPPAPPSALHAPRSPPAA